MLKQLVFIWLNSVSCNSGDMARLRMHKTLVFPQTYAFAIFESGKMFLNNGPKWSAVVKSRLFSVRKPVTLTLVALTSLSRSEPTAINHCVIGLCSLLLFNKSAFPWCSTEMDLSQIKQNKLYKVFCECVFLVIPAYFFLRTNFPEP